jgi:excisionase family DNA binding protein
MALSIPTDPIAASASEREAIDVIEHLAESREELRLVAGDATVVVPDAIRTILEQAAHELVRGNRVSLVPIGRMLTTRQAAELLNVSRPFLIGLLESDQIPFEMVGTHRRVPIDEVLRFREERSRGRRQALRQLSEEADELGIYTD